MSANTKNGANMDTEDNSTDTDTLTSTAKDLNAISEKSKDMEQEELLEILKKPAIVLTNAAERIEESMRGKEVNRAISPLENLSNSDDQQVLDYFRANTAASPTSTPNSATATPIPFNNMDIMFDIASMAIAKKEASASTKLQAIFRGIAVRKATASDVKAADAAEQNGADDNLVLTTAADDDDCIFDIEM